MIDALTSDYRVVLSFSFVNGSVQRLLPDVYSEDAELADNEG